MSEKDFLKEMGAKMRYHRNKAGLSLRELSNLCEIDHTQISFIEQGRVNSYVMSLKRIAEVLQVDIKDFF